MLIFNERAGLFTCTPTKQNVIFLYSLYQHVKKHKLILECPFSEVSSFALVSPNLPRAEKCDIIRHLPERILSQIYWNILLSLDFTKSYNCQYLRLLTVKESIELAIQSSQIKMNTTAQ